MSEIKLKNYTLKSGIKGILGIPDPNIDYGYSYELESTGFDYIHKIVMETKKDPKALDILKEYLEAFPEKINCQTDAGWTALNLACRNDLGWSVMGGRNTNRDNSAETVEILLAKTICDGPNRMCQMSKAHPVENVFDILNEAHLAHPDIDVNLQDVNGLTALHLACIDSNTNNSERTVKLLLSHPDINVNLQDKYGKTALHMACKHFNKESSERTIEMLLSHPDIDVNITNNSGETAMDKNKQRLYQSTVLHNSNFL